MAEAFKIEEIEEKVILVGVSEQDGDDAEDSVAELAELVKTAGATVVGTMIQKRELIHPGTYIGSGKVAELKLLVEELGATGIVCDDELSPAQLRNLEDMLDTKVMDRTLIILDIFAARALSGEGKIQVELAQLNYQSSRLVGEGVALSRLAGGIGTRGPGESKLEVNRRRIRERLTDLERELEQIERQRGLRRQSREKNGVPIVALVGYTNAGKSTLLNALTGADIPANNRLFDTLDTTTRTLEISDTCTVLLSDTVGFIAKLPHHLVEAFKATLEELTFADLVLHVIDASNPEWRSQAAVVEKLISELGAAETPRIDVFNKSDLYAGDIMPHGEEIVSISAKTGRGLDRLLEMIGARLDNGAHKVTLHLPYDRGGVLDMLYREARVEAVKYADTIEITAVCTPKVLGQVSDYIV